jgi:glycosyltransferase involved in cell wall biosynthesis
LGFYANAAQDRDKKILRAIASAQQQTFKDFEIIVIADGCQKTMDLVKDVDVRSFLIERGKLFGGAPRNKGIEEAKGEWIVYLDVDDIYGHDHLKIINESLNGYDWVWFNDIRYNPRKDLWLENLCDIRTRSKHGTSNVCHKKSLGVTWDAKGYAHDYFFVQSLLRFPNNAKITTPEYYVCHIPGTRNSGGYDL